MANVNKKFLNGVKNCSNSQECLKSLETENTEHSFIDKEELLSLLHESLKKPNVANKFLLEKRISYICSNLSLDLIFYYGDKDRFDFLSKKIKYCLKMIDECPDDNSYLRIFYTYVDRLYRMIRNYDAHGINYNSEKYYTDQIKELQKKKESLDIELDSLKHKSAEREGEYEEKEKELDIIKEQIRQSEFEKEELRKKLDAQDTIKDKISKAFVELKKHISHLENEKKRLIWMFLVYAILGALVFVLLVVFEILYLLKWDGADRWIDYLPYYVPVPIVGGLLWTFVSQMNRAQRQLMQVANVLHHIDYVEGLLLAINIVSVDANSASEKICNVLDNLIKNYMNTSDRLSEQSLDAEISKDSLDLHTFINLAKEVKDVIK